MTDQDIPLPRETTKLIGQDHANTQFLAAWNSGRLPHAWLLAGQRGIGKATLAYRIARFVLANPSESSDGLFDTPGPVPTTLDEGSDSPAARHVSNGTHPDLMVVTPTVSETTKRLRQNIVVDDVAAVSRGLRLTSTVGGWRVVVVDSADDMNHNAANALLKILEEPPQRVILLLISHAPGKLLPTIRSRCRKLDMPPLPDNLVKGLLDRLQPGLDSTISVMATDLAEGSIGRAVEIAASGGLDILEKTVQLLGERHPLDRRYLHATVEIFLSRDRGKEGDPVGNRLDLVLWWLGRCLRRYAIRETGSRETVAGEMKMVAGLVEQFGLPECCSRLEAARNELRKGVALNLDRKQMVTSVILNVAG